MRKIILASKSPRRKELMDLIGIEVEIDVVETSESFRNDVAITEAVEEIAKQKALAVSEKHKEDIIISADTIVLLENEILGKPHSKSEAFYMLSQLRNRKHQVITSVCILCDDRMEHFSSITEVEMMNYSDEMIRNYILTKEPLDKAGAYGIQGKGAVLVKAIHGDYYTVMGLPLAELYNRLLKYL
jgi:MAF protein